MREFYNSNSANRAINTYLDFSSSLDLSRKELLALVVIAYLGKTTQYYLSRVLSSTVSKQIKVLTSLNLITVEKITSEKHITFTYTPKSTKVFSESIMYVFANALFNIDKYSTNYNISSWNILASIVELPLHLQKNGHVNITDNLQCIQGGSANKSTYKNKLVNIGVIKSAGGSTQSGNYRLNRNAYLLGSCGEK